MPEPFCGAGQEPLVLLQSGASHISLPGLLPDAQTALISREKDLAFCLCLVNSDRVFSFLAHWAWKTKWVLVLKLVHELDGSAARRAPAALSWLLEGKDLLGLSIPVTESSAGSTELFWLWVCPYTLTIHLREFSLCTYWYKMTQQHSSLLPPLSNKQYQEGSTLDGGIFQKAKIQFLWSPLQHQSNRTLVSFAFN